MDNFLYVQSLRDATICRFLQTIQTEMNDSYHSLCIGLTQGKQGSRRFKHGQSMRTDIMTVIGDKN